MKNIVLFWKNQNLFEDVGCRIKQILFIENKLLNHRTRTRIGTVAFLRKSRIFFRDEKISIPNVDWIFFRGGKKVWCFFSGNEGIKKMAKLIFRLHFISVGIKEQRLKRAGNVTTAIAGMVQSAKLIIVIAVIAAAIETRKWSARKISEIYSEF